MIGRNDVMPMQLSATVKINDPVDFAAINADRISRINIPLCSSTAPNAIAAITSQIVTSMLLIPPRVSRLSTLELPVSDTKPFANASQTPLVIAIHCGRFGASAKASTTPG